jgi:hypothetical protein
VLVQQQVNSTPGAATLDATFSAPTTVDDLLVLIGASTDGPLQMPSGGGVSAWTFAAGSAANANIEIWYGAVTTSSSDPVTISRSRSGDLRLNITEWRGFNAQQIVLDEASKHDGTASPAFADPIDVHGTDLVIFGVASSEPDNNPATPSDGPWEPLMSIELSSLFVQSAWYQARSATTSLQPMSSVAEIGWDAAIAAFKVAP